MGAQKESNRNRGIEVPIVLQPRCRHCQGTPTRVARKMQKPKEASDERTTTDQPRTVLDVIFIVTHGANCMQRACSCQHVSQPGSRTRLPRRCWGLAQETFSKQAVPFTWWTAGCATRKKKHQTKACWSISTEPSSGRRLRQKKNSDVALTRCKCSESQRRTEERVS